MKITCEIPVFNFLAHSSDLESGDRLPIKMTVEAHPDMTLERSHVVLTHGTTVYTIKGNDLIRAIQKVLD